MNRRILWFLVLGFMGLNAFAERLPAISSFQSSRSRGYNDVWGYTDLQGREYALLGARNGTSIVEVTDAKNLREIAFIPSAFSTWKDIKTFHHYAYVVNERSGGMQIIDLSGLPEKVELVNTYTGFRTSHNIYIDKERKILFAEGNHQQPVRVLSLADPVNPVQISSLGVECHDIFARDGLLYVSEGGHGTIGIYSYEDPRNPQLVKRFQIPRAGYVHNAWLSEDSRYLMTTEENTGKTMKIFDLADYDNIQMVGEVLAPGRLAHNTHIKGNYAYVSHYGSGMRIYDISNPAEIREVAYWQKTDQSRGGFVSAWGAYPYFKSGKILISDIKDGLFVVSHESAKEE